MAGNSWIPDFIENKLDAAQAYFTDSVGDAMYPGSSDFKSFMENPANASMKTKLGELLGIDESAGAVSTEQAMIRLADQDPELFNKLNGIVNANGFEDFLDSALETESVMEAMHGHGSMQDSQILDTINSAHTRVEANPNYFADASNFIDNNQGLINTAGSMMAGSMEDPFSALDIGMGVTDMVGKLDGIMGEGFGQNLLNSLGPVLQQLGKMFEGLIDKFKSVFSGFKEEVTQIVNKPGEPDLTENLDITASRAVVSGPVVAAVPQAPQMQQPGMNQTPGVDPNAPAPPNPGGLSFS